MSQWPMVKLGDVVSLCGESIVDFSSVNDFPFIGLEHMAEGGGVAASSSVEDFDPKSAKSLYRKGDLLFGRLRPNLRKVALADTDGICSTDITVLTPKQDIDHRFLYFALLSHHFYCQVKNNVNGINLPRINAKRLLELMVPLPPLEEQRRIAQVLTQTSLNISNTKQQIDLLDTICRTPIFANPSRPSTELKEYIRTISTGKSVKDTSDPDSGNKILKISAVTSGFFKGNETKYLPVEYSPKESHAVAYGDLLVSRANTSEMIGASALVDQDESNVYLPDKLWKIFPVGDVPKEAIWHLLQLPTIRKRMSQVATGSSGSMKNISQRSFLKVEVPHLTLSEISSITEVVNRILSTRKLLLKQLALLEELHQSLATRAFAGQL